MHASVQGLQLNVSTAFSVKGLKEQYFLTDGLNKNYCGIKLCYSLYFTTNHMCVSK